MYTSLPVLNLIFFKPSFCKFCLIRSPILVKKLSLNFKLPFLIDSDITVIISSWAAALIFPPVASEFSLLTTTSKLPSVFCTIKPKALELLLDSFVVFALSFCKNFMFLVAIFFWAADALSFCSISLLSLISTSSSASRFIFISLK